MRLAALATVIALVACGGDDDGAVDASDPAAPDGSVHDAAPRSDAAAGFIPLVTADWTLESGTEGYVCATKTITEDVYAGVLRPIAPFGTHHTVIGLTTPTGPDNPSFPCGPEFGEFWASGVGTDELVLPEGVGLLAPAGQQLRLSLHLFNASDDPLSGTSGVEVLPLDPADVVHTARVDYHGPLGFEIPDNGMPTTVTEETTLGGGTLVAIFPHMHQLGTHFRAVLRRSSGAPTVLWDEDFQFESQEFAPLGEVPVQAGDVLETSCTWINGTKDPVGWGQSSTAEMCFTILMSY